ncbi:hypothetical protein B9Z55_000031 [Caenorhabditis nigoni]|uniref:Uncharacterized protein n=1 Tax=Caenorhabditis nigoni TaxID=1611254 RepID=A0A2G5VNH5_9PELO|nr:hypothetical protein B9Z55_000031 [Caenorhabditis nigoni]
MTQTPIFPDPPSEYKCDNGADGTLDAHPGLYVRRNSPGTFSHLSGGRWSIPVERSANGVCSGEPHICMFIVVLSIWTHFPDSPESDVF